MDDIESTFHHAIVREPGQSIIRGLTSSQLGEPDFKSALSQHQAYTNALRECGLTVTVLPAQESFPDAVFIEDTTIIAPPAAILTRPGALTRLGEEQSVRGALQPWFSEIEQILPPGTLEGGDVLRRKNHFYVGLSARTNKQGFEQFQHIVTGLGYSASAVPLKRFLHLKTGISYLGGNWLLTAGELIDHPQFSTFKTMMIAEEECYAANSIRVNDFVLVPAGFPNTRKAVEEAGFSILTVDVSEFRKLDGGLSCLSLRF